MTPRVYTVLIAIGGVLLLILAAALFARGDGMLGALMGASAGGAVAIASERRQMARKEAARIEREAEEALDAVSKIDTGAYDTEIEALIREEAERGR